jgi:hypothetical protein
MGQARGLLLVGLFLAMAACAGEKQDDGVKAPTDADLENLTQGLGQADFDKLGKSDQAELDGLVGKGGAPTIKPGVVRQLATLEARRDLPTLGADAEPLFFKLLPGFDGKPGGYVAVYSLDGSTAEDMLARIKQGFLLREKGLKEKNRKKIHAGELLMMQPSSYLTVILGAGAQARGFIRSHFGAPRFLTAGFLAHKKAAMALELPLDAIRIVGGAFDNRAGPGDGFGVVLEVKETHARHVFLLYPDLPFEGDLLTMEELAAAKAEYAAAHPLPGKLKEALALKWKKTVGAAGLATETAGWCVSCQSLEGILQVPDDGDAFGDHLIAVADRSLEDLLESLDQEGVEPCSDCSDHVAACWLSQHMAPGFYDPPDGECTGYTWSLASTGFISGVPNFKQWHDHFYTAFLDDGIAAVGCGPVAAATVLAWFDMLGFDALITGAGHSTGQSETYTGWMGVAVRLNELMDTFEAGSAAATPSGDFEDGLEAYIEERGYTGGLVEVDSKTDVITEVVEGRPLILLYTSGGWARDHYAVIVGFYDDPGDDDFYIHVATGWGGYEAVIMENGDAVTAGITRYHWDDLYEGVQDAKIYRFRIYSGDTAWDGDSATCDAFDPCDDLDLDSCVDYAVTPPYRDDDPVAVRPPNLPDPTCTLERQIFDGTDCTVKFWGGCLEDAGRTFTCDGGAEDGGAYLDDCMD